MTTFVAEAHHSTGETKHVHSPETELWIEVVARALLDIGFRPEGTDPKKIREGEKVRRDAMNWIFNDLYAQDFELTCQYAGLDPAWVRRLAKTAPERLAAGLARETNNDT